ncbi:MAG: toll/interleukin-1 receptor domain-containing protein [Minwuia sp.]|uniref:toll/interleukin-1 receptor domain-containing protein n=1 Tax=Minwuia sp. TaxID=2493630 RepID=UPI003A84ABAD
MDETELELGGDDAKVFLSYSRKDRERAQRIADVLRERHFGVFKDTDDILPTEEWKDRLEQLIAEADTVVFLLSPHSATSEVCAWEVEHATALNKRIAPIVIEETDSGDIPPLLARLNFIFCTERDRFEDAVDSLVSALHLDIQWIREHTRLAGLADRWEKAGKPTRLLLRGQDIADAEAWRDSHPKDAPEVTQAQAALISESRRGAARRQRSWVIGSLGVAAATVALAVFAWFQSVEADRQRGVAEANAVEADRQRGVAEENAAEAARQRDSAEQQRREALLRLAGDRLRSNDRPGGISALMEAGVDDVRLKVLASGIADPDPLMERLEPGVPVMWNGELYMRSDGDRKAIPLPAFPASQFVRVGASTAMFSETGAIRLHDGAGKTLAEATPARATRPCAANWGPQGSVRLFSVHSPGYSACSLRVTMTRLSETTIDEPQVISVCEEEGFEVSGWREPMIGVADIGEVCSAALGGGGYPDLSGFDGALSPPSLILPFRYPEMAGEGGLWSAEQSLDPVAVTNDLLRRVVGDESIPRGNRRNFGITNFANAEAAWYILPQYSDNAAVRVVSAITSWGGTGGETDEVCIGPPGETLSCTSFHHFSGYNGYSLSRTGGVIVFGEGMSAAGDGENAGPNNAWVTTSPAEPLRPVEGIASYGEVLDAAFGPDGRIALLTPTTIIVLDADGRNPQLVNRPEASAAMEWLSSGELVVMARNGILHAGEPGEGFSSTRLVAESEFPSVDANGDPSPIWLAESEDGRFLGSAVNRVFVLLDPELSAPMTTGISVPDPQMDNGRTDPAIVVKEDGEVVLIVNGRTYRRRAFPDEGVIADLVDPEAPLRASPKR